MNDPNDNNCDKSTGSKSHSSSNSLKTQEECEADANVSISDNQPKSKIQFDKTNLDPNLPLVYSLKNLAKVKTIPIPRYSPINVPKGKSRCEIANSTNLFSTNAVNPSPQRKRPIIDLNKACNPPNSNDFEENSESTPVPNLNHDPNPPLTVDYNKTTKKQKSTVLNKERHLSLSTGECTSQSVNHSSTNISNNCSSSNNNPSTAGNSYYLYSISYSKEKRWET